MTSLILGAYKAVVLMQLNRLALHVHVSCMCSAVYAVLLGIYLSAT
jgi:hypothetical protein